MSRASAACAFTVLALAGASIWVHFDLLVALRVEFGLYTTATVEVSPSVPESLLAPERCAARERIADNVIAGRLTLAEAAEEVRRDERLFGPQVLQYFPGRTINEKSRRAVIVWVEANEDSVDPHVSHRLHAELAEWLQRSPIASTNPE